MQQQSANWRERLRQAPIGAKVALGIGAGILSCCVLGTICAASLAVLGATIGPVPTHAPSAQAAATPTLHPAGAASPTAMATATPTAVLTPALTPTAFPTASPSVVPTSTSTGVTAARLGGPDSAFYAAYGYEADNLFDVNGVTFSLNDDTGSDGTPHAFEMLVYPSDAHIWTMDEAKPVCSAFLPPDAVYARSITSSGGNPEDVYTSAQAKASFAPTSPWYTADGSVSITYEPPSGGTGVFQCSMSLGTI